MKWYNENLKKDFVNHYQGAISEYGFNSIFKKSAELEEQLEKDCCAFNLDEIMDLARSYRSADASSLQLKMSILRQYAQYCIDLGMSDNGLNHYSEIPTSAYPQLIDKKKMAQTYISRKEVESIVASMDNPRDKFVILAPFEGIYGKNLCEILELTRHDLLGDNKVRLCTGREIEVTSMLYGIMEDAAEETTAVYFGIRKPLVDCDLIFKPLKAKNVQGSTERAMKKKFSLLKKHLGRETFGVKMLYVSGLLNEVDKLVQEYGDFEAARKGIPAIQERYASDYKIRYIRKMYEEMKSIQEI